MRERFVGRFEQALKHFAGWGPPPELPTEPRVKSGAGRAALDGIFPGV